MATATKEKRKRTIKFVAKLPVKFKNLSVGDEAATLGFSCTRDSLNVLAAEEMFCGKRLEVRLLAGPGASGDMGQGILWDDVQYDVEDTADVKKFSVSPKLIAAGLTFSINSGVDVMELTHFAKREGVLLVIKVLGETNEEEPETEPDPADEDNSQDEE